MLGVRRPHLLLLLTCVFVGITVQLYNLDLWDLTTVANQQQSDGAVVARQHGRVRQNETDAVVPTRGSRKHYGHNIIADDHETVVSEAERRDERRQRKHRKRNDETDAIIQPEQVDDEDDNISPDDGGETQQLEKQQKRQRQNEKVVTSNDQDEYKKDRIIPHDNGAALSKILVDTQQHGQQQLSIQNLQNETADARIPEQDKYQDDHISPDDGVCIPMHGSVEHPIPNGNTIHELDFFNKYITGEIQHIAHGGFNDVFQYKDEPTGKSLVLKILSSFRKFTDNQYRAVQLDTIMMERLTKSPHIFDVYGHVGFTVLVPFVTGGTLESKMTKWRNGEIHLDSITRLQYAVDIAKGLRDLHNIHGDGVPSAIHGDLHELQYLFHEDGRLLLGDFNKGQFLRKSSTTGRPCTYKPNYVNMRKLFRSPQEYMDMGLTAAADVYALGSLIYYVMTGMTVWERWLGKKYLSMVRQKIIDGKRPKIKNKIRDSKDPVDIALITAYNMCTHYEPEERSSAKEVSDYLESVWIELNKR
eukprot:scaffold14654_cov50-Cyclotella_meneghiniana.AAC.4